MTAKKIGPLLVILIVSVSNIHLLPDIYAEATYSTITLAENKVGSAFLTIHLAEIEGADIRLLVYKLNNAIDLLSLAKKQYNNGDTKSSSENALMSIEESNTIEVEAQEARISAIEHAELKIEQNYYVSRITILIVFFSFLIMWRIIKDYYKNRVLKMKLVGPFDT